MILLLGDELIRDAGLAVFELVKNAYDADASRCVVSMNNIESPDEARIIIEDNGSGMDLKTIRRVWLEPGTENRKQQRQANERTPKGRLPLGEKGVGRFAVHKLGQKIQVVTKSEGKKEIVITIAWADFATAQYLSEVPVKIRLRSKPRVFQGATTGTRIEVSDLRDPASWTRGKVRDLARSITSICSPFRAPSGFRAKLVLDPPSDWLDGLLDPKTVVELSLFRATGRISGQKLVYDYRFVPLPQMGSTIAGREVLHVEEALMRPRSTESLSLSKHRIGDFKFDFFIFDRDPAVLNLLESDKAGLKKFLDYNGGIRIYRDGVRVFDFGEPGNDWLGLGDRRVQIPTIRVGNNQIIGAITLDAHSSTGLVEKTNREGFLETDAYKDFRDAVLFALTQIEIERAKDKARLRDAYSRGTVREPVIEDLSDLRDELRKRKLTAELGPYVDRIETQFEQVRDTLMTAAAAGLTLTTVIHEVEKIIKELVKATQQGAGASRIAKLVEHLDHIVEGLAFLVRHSGMRSEKASVLINQALFNSEYRLRDHSVHVINGIDNGDPDFSLKCSRRLIVSTLMNLIDNSIYWLESKGGERKNLYIGTTTDFEGKPAIIVADSGPGFRDPPEFLVRPFITRKSEGSGLGLHLANEVAKLHKGALVFPDHDEVKLPPHLDGAVVAISFREAQ